MMTHGEPKPVATGKKGNVGGISTPGRHGSHKAAMMAGVKNLVAPGPGMTKKVKHIVVRPEPEGRAIDAGAVKAAAGMPSKAAAGSPKDISMGSGHKGIHIGLRPEPAVKRDSASVIKPHGKV